MDMKKLGERVEVPAKADCGPAMRKLNDNQRRFVAAMGVFGNNRALAYQWAYGQDNKNAAAVAACRLGDRDHIKAAINEHYLDRRTMVMPALITDTLIEMMGPTNLDDKTKLKAVQLAIDLVPGLKAAVQMEFTHTHRLSMPELEEKARQLQEKLNMPKLEAPKDVIDVDFEVVDPELADIM